MHTTTPLHEAGYAAVTAAQALADGVKPTASAKRLNVADHTDLLEALRFTIAGMTFHGILPRTRSMIRHQRDDYAQLHNPLGRRFAGSLTELYDLTDRALTQARHADSVDAAYQHLRAERRRLAGQRAPAAEPARRRNMLLGRTADATAAISTFAAQIKPSGGTFVELVTALSGDTEVVLALQLTCVREAKLVDIASEAAGLGQGLAIVSETLTAAGKALGNAYETLATAANAAKEAAGHERRAMGAA